MFRVLFVSSFYVLSGLSFNASAKEIGEGTVEIEGGGEISLSSLESTPTSGSTSETDSITLDVTATYYFRPNIGVGLIINKDKTEVTSSSSTTKLNSYSYGPRVSYNIGLSKNTNAGIEAAYVKVAAKRSSPSTITDADGSGYLLGVGIKNFVSESVSVNWAIQYASVSQESSPGVPEIEIKGIGVGASLSVYLD